MNAIAKTVVETCDAYRAGKMDVVEYGMRMSVFMDPKVIENLARSAEPITGETRKGFDLAQHMLRSETEANADGQTIYYSEDTLTVARAMIKTTFSLYWALRTLAKIKNIATVPYDDDKVIEYAANMHRHLAKIKDLAQAVQDEEAK